jgi:hypothetical protein
MMSQPIYEEGHEHDLLLGDFFHWKLDRTGHFVIEQNEREFTGDFQTVDVEAITEMIADE